MVDLQGLQRLVRYGIGDGAVRFYLGEVPHPAEHPVGDTGCTPGAPGDLHSPGGLNRHMQDAGTAGNDLRQLLRGVQLQPQGHAKAIPQRRGKLSGPGGGADKREMGQVQPDGVG